MQAGMTVFAETAIYIKSVFPLVSESEKSLNRAYSCSFRFRHEQHHLPSGLKSAPSPSTLWPVLTRCSVGEWY